MWWKRCPTVRVIVWGCLRVIEGDLLLRTPGTAGGWQQSTENRVIVWDVRTAPEKTQDIYRRSSRHSTKPFDICIIYLLLHHYYAYCYCYYILLY